MHRVLIGVVVTGAVIIAGIGFTGSYAAVRALALKKGFGTFSYVFPIGIDAGICVLLALDLLLTWIRIPFPLLRQTAWVLTAATIAFNGAAAWPDPLGVGMHAVIPILFVVSVEAARHAIGRMADITADKHMEGVRLTRWLLSPLPTFLLWRRMKLWELRSYEQVIKLEQERLVYQARLRSRFGRAWRRKAPVESLMPLRLARYGVPLAETAGAGLAAAGIEPAVVPAAQQQLRQAQPQAQAQLQQQQFPAPSQAQPQPQLPGGPAAGAPPHAAVPHQRTAPPGPRQQGPGPQGEPGSPWFKGSPEPAHYQGGYDPTFDPDYDLQYLPEEQYEDWYEGRQQPEQPQERHLQDRAFQRQFREQFEEQYDGPDGAPHEAPYEGPYEEQQYGDDGLRGGQEPPSMEETGSFPIPVSGNRTRELGEGVGSPEPDEDAYYQVFKQSINGSYPTPREFGENVDAEFRIVLPPDEAKRMVNRFTNRYNAELEEDHIA
ncbi:DUF2637 domain-containing protein [Streptomyces sp. NPDC047000]|uniref:DUF2637 domain-containing protein n=1 Tax=Streptomyces sp. NPDC047000 TaxID=3155474 RepID=UPI0033CC8A92